jgi:hypothetical protein
MHSGRLRRASQKNLQHVSDRDNRPNSLKFRSRNVSVYKRPDNSEIHQEPSVYHRADRVLVIKLEPGNCQVSPVAHESISGPGVITQPPQGNLDLSQLTLIIMTICRQDAVVGIRVFLGPGAGRRKHSQCQKNELRHRVLQDICQRGQFHSFFSLLVTIRKIDFAA